MKIIALPAFADNYIWLMHEGGHALVVDPGDAEPVLQALEHGGLQLAAILVTHHHPDPTGGAQELREATGAQVYGPARERIPAPSIPLKDGDTVAALGTDFAVLDVPGHTAGPIAFHAADDSHCRALRERQMPTLPSSLSVGLQINPFLRSPKDTVIRAVLGQTPAANDEIAVFAALRQRKNVFK